MDDYRLWDILGIVVFGQLESETIQKPNSNANIMFGTPS